MIVIRYVANIRKIGKRFKMVCMDPLRHFGGGGCYDRRSSERGTVHEDKLSSSISRTKRTIIEYGLCNEWDYFVTLTLDPEKYDRYNLPKYRKDLAQFFRNYSRLKLIEGNKIRYVLVPERHQDGAWHVHGLLSGLPPEHLTDFDPACHPLKLVNSGYKNWPAYEKKFGYFSAGEIRNQEAVIFYMIKYITKDLAKNAVELNNHMVFASQGLNKAEYVAKDAFFELDNDFVFDYENEYCKVKNVGFIEDLPEWIDENVCIFGDGTFLVDGNFVCDYEYWERLEREYEESVGSFVRDCYGDQLTF